ncbi:MAG: gliding motility-associated C-terminal domain-containing protein [Bacteroidales bacterium]|nr:gliding motility-associated C-terminal domain-containing protein [Bacteroidales bacterium]
MQWRLIIIIVFSFNLFGFSQNAFVENKGQWHPNALFRLTINNGAIFPENNSITYCFFNTDEIKISSAHHQKNKLQPIEKVNFHAYRMTFLDALPSKPIPTEPYRDYENFFLGNDPNKWATKARRFKRLTWKNIYQGIDYTLYVNNENNIQYDFIVHPGAEAEKIRLKYEGQDSIYIDNEGCVVIKTSVNKVQELKPYAYQHINGKEIKVPCRFFIFNQKYLTFQFPEGYNTQYPLVIDPVLVFSTYSGSLSDNWGFTATFDDLGNAFSGGIVFNTGYPTTLGAFQVNYAGGEPYSSTWYQFGCDIGIIKYTANGTQRLWATYLGGTISEELPHSLVCNRSNDLIIMGTTGSSDFPVSPNAYDATFNGGTNIVYDNVIRFSWGLDIFVTRLSADGSQLLGSTFIGGTQNDGFNFRDYYTNFLMTGSPSTLYYNYADGARGEVICDPAGNIYVASCTFSPDFPVTPGAFQTTYSGQQEGVLFKLNPDCSQLIWSTFFGGSNDDAIYSLDLDQNNDVYFAGGTLSSNIPTTGGVVQPINPGIGSVNGFIGHLSANGNTLIKSTYWGTSAYDQVYFIKLDKSKNIYVTGQTEATGNAYIINAAYGVPNSGQFITKFPNNLSSPIWSTAFGTGIGRPNISLTAFSVDFCNRVYVSGWGREWAGNWATIQGTKNMFVTNNAFQSQTDGQDFYLMVLADDASHIEYATFFGELNYSTCGYSGHDHVDGGTSRFDKRGNIYQSVCASCGGCNQFPTYPNPGAWSNNNGNAGNNCNNALFKFSFALPLTVADFFAHPVCVGTPIQFQNNSQLATDYFWNFGDGTTSTQANPTHTYSSPGTYNVTLIANNPSSCNMADTIVRQVVVEQLIIQTSDTSVCYGNSVQITANVTGNIQPVTYVWDTHCPIQDTLNNSLSNSTFSVNPSQTQTYYVQVSSGICTAIDSVKVTVHRIELQSTPDTMICAQSQIQISVTPTHTTGTVQYQWQPSAYIVSGGQTANPIVNPSQNTTFYVTVTDAFGCSAVDSIRVEIDPFNASFSQVNPVLCYNECIGFIQVSVNQPVLPVTYIWNNGQQTAQISNLCAGTYTVTVTDGLGCSKVLSTSFSNPPLLEGSIQVLSPASCDPLNPNTGAIQVTAWGGTPSYHYHWNTNDTFPNLQNLFAGTYTVTITDQNGCDTILSATISDPSPLQILATAEPTLCYGSCDGSAQVYITTQGTPPYTYVWNTGQTTTSIQNLCAGGYVVTVTDAEYCVRVFPVTVQQPDSIRPILTIPPIKCNGDTTFIAISQVLGGTPPFVYLWNNGSTSSSLHGISSGQYWLEITDAHGCKDTTHISITQPTILTATANVINTLCTSSCNGSIVLQPIGGTSPYSYLWNSGQQSASINSLCEGTYRVTITDANGCTYVQEQVVGNNHYVPPLEAQANPIYIYNGQTSQLYAQTSVNGQLIWSPTQTLSNWHIKNPIASPAQTTTYYVQITDANGCTNIDSITVYVMDVVCREPYIYVPNAFTPNGDGNNDILYVRAGMATDLYFAIYDRWGELIFETTDQHKGWDGTFKGKPMDPAVFVYYLSVTCLDKMKFEKKGNITLIR